jgi:hypothetical protein
LNTFTRTLMAAIAFVVSLVALTAFAQDTYVLITQEEFSAELEAPEVEYKARQYVDPQRPKINLLRPGAGGQFTAPVDIELEFEAAEGAEIDPGTLKVTYGRLGIDVTERVIEHATLSKDGLVSENADLPLGRHRLTVTIYDTEGRVGEMRFNFQIARQVPNP